MKKMVIWSVTCKQVPFPVVVNVSVKLPEEISAAVGVYVALSVLLFGANTPSPPVHCPPVAIVTLPANVVAALFAHFVWSGPAFAVGGEEKKMVIWSVTCVHVPFPVELNVNVTLPAEISPALGV